MAEEENPSNTARSKEHELELLDGLREVHMERAMNLSMKYVMTSCDAALSMVHLSLEENMTPNRRLAEKLLPLLREQLNHLVLSIDRGSLLKDYLAEIDTILDDFERVEKTLDQVYLTVPLCWVEAGEKESHLEDLEFRRVRLRSEHLQLIVRLSPFFCFYSQFWEAAKFSENHKPQAEDEKKKVIDAFDSSCKQIDVLIKFLQNSLFSAINDDFQRYVRSTNYTLSRFQEQSEYIDDPIFPVVKLARSFMNKLSRSTNNDLVLFRRMPSKELVQLQRAACCIGYWVERLGKHFLNNPHNHEDLIDSLARTVASFDKCFEHLNPFLKSPPPDVDPSLAQAASQWFIVWRDQLFRALYNVCECTGCDFPTPQQIATASTDPLR